MTHSADATALQDLIAYNEEVRDALGTGKPVVALESTIITRGMGITIAWFCLGSGLISILGGALMSVSIYLPFTLGLVSFGIALTFIFTLWRAAEVQALDPAPSKESLDNAVGADDKADL